MQTRLALQLQGVKEAGMVKEVYTGGATGVIIAPRARAAMVAGGFKATGFGTFAVER